MSNLLNITVSIADRPYRLKITKDEEAKVREAAKMLNEKIAEYQNSYRAKDKQDYLAMVALLLTTDFLELKHQNTELKKTELDILEQVEQTLNQLEENAPID